MIIFVIGFVVALTAGYFVFQGESASDTPANETASPVEESSENEAETEDVEVEVEEDATTVSVEGRVIEDAGCLSCHAVSGLDLLGGATGPDLTDTFNNIEAKHGKELAEFLKEPTSAVMSSVIEADPLTDEDIADIVNALEIAAQ